MSTGPAFLSSWSGSPPPTAITSVDMPQTALPIPSLHLRLRRRVKAAAMADGASAPPASAVDHVAGECYSVPELRLRDHRFAVPLDYSLDPRTSQKIRVFARELQGTGLSTPLTASSMLQIKSAKELSEYLKHFRADSIVNDAEFIRVHMVPDAGPWTILGQLLELILQNEKYYKRLPQDIEIVREVVLHLADSEEGGVPLPSGGILTPRGLQLLGLAGLGSSTGFERLHYMFD